MKNFPTDCVAEQSKADVLLDEVIVYKLREHIAMFDEVGEDKKLLKALIRVHNYFTCKKDHIE